MKHVVRLGGLLVAGWILMGCDTTGDPRQGGLFGWSEAKARDRRKEREDHVTGEQAALDRENTRRNTLEKRDAGADLGLASATREHQRGKEGLHTQEKALLAKVDRLETESLTPASASRARTYRRTVTTIAAQPALTTAQRSERLRAIEMEIDAALERLNR